MEEERKGSVRGKAKGFTLVFDVVRRFAQPLGIDLPKWEGRVIETKKGVVRLLPIAERAKQLFGEDGAQAVAARLDRRWPRHEPAAVDAIPGPGGRPRRFAGGVAAAARSEASRSRTRAWPPPARPRPSIASTRPCCSRPVAVPTRCARCSKPTGARPGLPAPRQRLLRALSEGERREAID